jgi:hypothetical protein
MSSQIVSLKASNRATLYIRTNGRDILWYVRDVSRREVTNEPEIFFSSFSTHFRHAFKSVSPFSANFWFSLFSPQKFAGYLSRLRRAVTSRRQHKPNPKGIFV